MKKFLLTVGMLGLSATSAFAKSDNLVDILNLALKNDPQYLAAIAGSKAVEERYNQARAVLLPTITGTATWSETTQDQLIVSGAGVGETEFTSDNKNLVLELNQSIYNHGNWIRLDNAKKQILQNQFSLEAEKQGLIVRAAEAYLDVLSAQDSLEFAKAETKAIGQQLEQIKQRFDVGLIAITDVHEAQADYDRALSSEIQTQNTLDNAREALREITGRYHNTLATLSNQLQLQTPTPANIDAWVSSAEKSNLALQAQKVAVEIADSVIGQRQADHYPSVSAFASIRENLEDVEPPGGNFVGSISTGDSTSFGIRFNIPIFSGGNTLSQTREARHVFAQEAQTLELRHRQAQRNTRSAYLGVIAGISSVKSLTQALLSNQSALDASKAGFEVGTRTIVDVLLATRALFQAKSSLSRAKYDYIINVLRLKQSAGVLEAKDIAMVNNWLKQ